MRTKSINIIGFFMFSFVYSNIELNSCDFGYIESNNSSQESCVPELFYYNSSTQQAAYFFENVILDGISLNENDWVGAFSGDVCVGARKWDIDNCNGICDIPILGQDSPLTSGYMLTGELPTFKIFQSSSLSYFEAFPSENIYWTNFSTPVINLLYACDQSDCTPDCLGINGGLAEFDCSGVCNGNAIEDCNGVCNGLSLVDCSGICNGNSILDQCGICDGDSSSCVDCLGVPNGNAIIDCEGVCDGSANDCNQLGSEIVKDFILINTYPNPFNPSVTIEFSLYESNYIQVTIYNVNGTEINTILNNQYLYEGTHRIDWDGKNENGYIVPSGTYIINLSSSNKIYTKKVTFVK